MCSWGPSFAHSWQKWGKLPNVNKNCQKMASENRKKLPKRETNVDKNWQKLTKANTSWKELPKFGRSWSLHHHYCITVNRTSYTHFEITKYLLTLPGINIYTISLSVESTFLFFLLWRSCEEFCSRFVGERKRLTIISKSKSLFLS